MMKNLEEIKSLHLKFLPNCHFDHIAFAYIDFKNHNSQSWVIRNGEQAKESEEIYFDLASLTKPLTLGTHFLKHLNIYTEEQKLLLEHRAGLPAYGSLSKKNWRDQILNYPLNDSATLYSDFSSLRLMLEIGEDKLCSEIEEDLSYIKFWKDLNKEEIKLCPSTGFRLGRPIKGVVHDPNAFTIDAFCSHSGLFGTINGVAQTLLHLNQKYDLLKRHYNRSNESEKRLFFEGWEGITNLDNTLAGKGAGVDTFGFLGFTGTSLWIDPHQEKGWVLLTNATKNYWYERKKLNELRRKTGELAFSKKRA